MIVTLPNHIPLKDLIEFARDKGCEVVQLRNGHLQFVESADKSTKQKGVA